MFSRRECLYLLVHTVGRRDVELNLFANLGKIVDC